MAPEPATLLEMCIRKHVEKLFNAAASLNELTNLPSGRLRWKMLEILSIRMQREQKEFLQGFSGEHLDKMCTLVGMFLNKQVTRVTLPKCQVNQEMRNDDRYGELSQLKDIKPLDPDLKRQNLTIFLRLLDEVVEKAPNLMELQIACDAELMADRSVAERILDKAAALKQLQALDMPGFHCSGTDIIEISNLMPNLSFLRVKMCVRTADVEAAVSALAQMPRLRHLVFETRTRRNQELHFNIFGSLRRNNEMSQFATHQKLVVTCLQRMPLLRRCGRTVDLRRIDHFLGIELEDCISSHMRAMSHRTATNGQPLQLEELFYHNYPDTYELADSVLRMPNLRALALRLCNFHASVLNLFGNVTELSLILTSGPQAMQLLNLVGHQLTKISFLQVPTILLGDVFDACPNLEEAHWLNMSRSVTNAAGGAAALPISAAHLRRLRALTLRQANSEHKKNDGAVVASLLLAAPRLERVYLENVDFGAADLEALTAAVEAGSALQRLRLFCANMCWNSNELLWPRMEQLLMRMRTNCPRFEKGFDRTNATTYDTYSKISTWRQYFCDDF